jgi:hypothetical protein
MIIMATATATERNWELGIPWKDDYLCSSLSHRNEHQRDEIKQTMDYLVYGIDWTETQDHQSPSALATRTDPTFSFFREGTPGDEALGRCTAKSMLFVDERSNRDGGRATRWGGRNATILLAVHHCWHILRRGLFGSRTPPSSFLLEEDGGARISVLGSGMLALPLSLPLSRPSRETAREREGRGRDTLSSSKRVNDLAKFNLPISTTPFFVMGDVLRQV